MLLLVTVVCFLASPGFAVDGTIEINQAKAIAGGVSSCDTPGFPVEICESGSYRLTSNLDVPSGQGAIYIQAENSHIDLGGMTVKGTAACTIEPLHQWVVSCVRHGGFGIFGGLNSNSSVANGTVRGFDNCVKCDRAQALTVTGCAGTGLDVSEVADSVSSQFNGVFGIQNLQGGRLSNIIASHNHFHGLVLGLGSTASGVVAYQNGFVGVLLRAGGSLDHFSAVDNGTEGVEAQDGSLVSYGAIRSNGRADNTKYALKPNGGAGYRALVITSQNQGNTASVEPGLGGVNLGDNTCQGTICPP